MRSTMRRGAALAVLAVTAGVGAAVPANAGTAGTLEVTAVDFAFEGVPTSLDAGKYTIAFSNDGAEPHLIAVARLTEEGAAMTDDEIFDGLDAGDDSFIDKVAGFAFAPPNADSDGKLKAKNAGEYAYVCFIGNEAGPHYRQGMFGRFTVE
jgi:plastocyanin